MAELSQTEVGLIDPIGVTDMAEIARISKQAMSKRMETSLFRQHVKIVHTRNGRLVERSQFMNYNTAWTLAQAEKKERSRGTRG